MILITGGAGFIGSNIAARLAADGYRVAVCDRFGSDDRWRNLARLDLDDIVAPPDVLAWIATHRRSLRAVVHMGAISATTERDVDLILRENYHLSRNLWAACAAAELPFIYASSAAVYGDGSNGFDDDSSAAGLERLRPLNPYGWSKLLFDRFAARAVVTGAARPPQHAGLRFFNVYGPNEYHKGPMRSVVHQVHGRVAAQQPVTLFRSHNPSYADGGQMRDFIHVSDCAEVVAWLLAHPDTSGIFNFGTGQARTFLDLARAVFRSLGHEPHVTFVDTPEALRAQYQYFTQARMERLRAAGYARAFLSLEDGVADYVTRYLATPDPYA